MQTEEIQKIALDALNDLKGINITVLDVRTLTDMADTMIVCSGRSSRHAQSLAQNVVTSAKQHKVSFIKMEGEKEGEWILVDLGDVIVHVMQASTREFYRLEDLWEPLKEQREKQR
jgi:ribosome-associated protein